MDQFYVRGHWEYVSMTGKCDSRPKNVFLYTRRQGGRLDKDPPSDRGSELLSSSIAQVEPAACPRAALSRAQARLTVFLFSDRKYDSVRTSDES